MRDSVSFACENLCLLTDLEISNSVRVRGGETRNGIDLHSSYTFLSFSIRDAQLPGEGNNAACISVVNAGRDPAVGGGR